MRVRNRRQALSWPRLLAVCVRGSIDQTVARIRDALDMGLSLQINTTVSRHSLEDLPKAPNC